MRILTLMLHAVRRGLLTFLILLAPPMLASGAEPARVGDFSLLDAHGYFHSMSWYDDHRALVLLSHSSTDASMSRAIAKLESLADSAADEFEFFLIDSEGKHNREAIAVAMAERGSELPVLMDDAQLIGEALALSHSGEFIVFDPRSFIVVGRGHNLESQYAQVQALLGAMANGGDYAAAAEALAASSKLAAAGQTAVTIDYPARRLHAANTPSYRERTSRRSLAKTVRAVTVKAASRLSPWTATPWY